MVNTGRNLLKMGAIIKAIMKSLAVVATTSMLLTTPVHAAACGAGDGASFLKAFPTWYEYLELDPTTCEVKNFQMPGDLWKVGLAIVAILLRVAGMIAVGYTIYGGFKFVLSKGNPTEAAKARQTVIDAIIGMAIASIAIVFVGFLGRTLTR